MKSYFNFLRRNALYTAVNLLGLSLSMAFVLLVSLYVVGELSVEADNPNKDRIYRLETENMAQFPALVDRDVTNYLPSVEATLRLHPSQSKVMLGDGSKSFQGKIFADSTFFDFFPAPFLAGDAARALVAMDQVVLTETYATGAFGSPQKAMGESLQIDGRPYIVSGVVGDYGKNSLIENAPLIVRFENLSHVWEGYFKGYDAANFMIFVRLTEGATVPTDRLEALVEYYKGCFWIFEQERSSELRLNPLTEVYWGEAMWGLRGNERSFVGILIGCALAVLLFAAINYTNLTVAQAHLRARQSALKRLLGSSPRAIFWGFMGEAFVLCGVALVLAGLLASLAAPWFGGLVGSSVALETLFSPTFFAPMVGLFLVLGLVTGFVPAWIAMRFEPIQIVRGDFSRRAKLFYGRLAIGVQFVVTIVLVGISLIFLRQTHHMISSELGFDSEQLLVVDLAEHSERIWAFGDFLKSHSAAVQHVSLSTGAPFVDNNTNNGEIDGVPFSFRMVLSDSLYVQTMGFSIVRTTGIHTPGSVWINQTAARKLGLTDDATDMPWLIKGKRLQLRGVLKDFYQHTMSSPITELIVADLAAPLVGEGEPYVALVRVKTDDPIATRKEVERLWSEFTQGEPFSASWLDQTIEQVYESEKRTATLVGLLSVLAVVVSAMGIFAASIYGVRRQRREIAVRRIYGSSVGEIFGRLIRTYVVVWAVASVVALPVVWWVGERWLEQFAYRIGIFAELLFASLGVLVVALACLSVQIFRAARTQPANSLKTE